MKTPHKHAELIKAWADGAKIQRYSSSTQEWVDTTNPHWFLADFYRIKPETIRIGDIDVPKPLTSLEGRECIYVVNITSNLYNEYCDKVYLGSYCRRMIELGLAHSSEANAIIHAKALIAISGGVT